MKDRIVTADLLYMKHPVKRAKVEGGRRFPADIGLHHEEPHVFAVLCFNDKVKDCEGYELER
jgi:hypothetical protein